MNATVDSKGILEFEVDGFKHTAQVTIHGFLQTQLVELVELRAAVQRTAALPAKWRKNRHYDVETHDKCADELETALRGQP